MFVRAYKEVGFYMSHNGTKLLLEVSVPQLLVSQVPNGKYQYGS
jgi:hypothetical protein